MKKKLSELLREAIGGGAVSDELGERLDALESSKKVAEPKKDEKKK